MAQVRWDTGIVEQQHDSDTVLRKFHPHIANVALVTRAVAHWFRWLLPCEDDEQTTMRKNLACMGKLGKRMRNKVRLAVALSCMRPGCFEAEWRGQVDEPVAEGALQVGDQHVASPSVASEAGILENRRLSTGPIRSCRSSTRERSWCRSCACCRRAALRRSVNARSPCWRCCVGASPCHFILVVKLRHTQSASSQVCLGTSFGVHWAGQGSRYVVDRCCRSAASAALSHASFCIRSLILYCALLRGPTSVFVLCVCCSVRSYGRRCVFYVRAGRKPVAPSVAVFSLRFLTFWGTSLSLCLSRHVLHKTIHSMSRPQLRSKTCLSRPRLRPPRL